MLLAAASLTTVWRALRLIAETLLHTLQAKSKTVRKTKAKRTIIIQKSLHRKCTQLRAIGLFYLTKRPIWLVNSASVYKSGSR